MGLDSWVIYSHSAQDSHSCYMVILSRALQGEGYSPMQLPGPCPQGFSWQCFSFLLPHHLSFCPSSPGDAPVLGSSAPSARPHLQGHSLLTRLLKAPISSHMEPNPLKRGKRNLSNSGNRPNPHRQAGALCQQPRALGGEFKYRAGANFSAGRSERQGTNSANYRSIYSIASVQDSVNRGELWLKGLIFCHTISPSPSLSRSYRLLLRCMQTLVTFFQPCNCTNQWHSQP